VISAVTLSIDQNIFLFRRTNEKKKKGIFYLKVNFIMMNLNA